MNKDFTTVQFIDTDFGPAHISRGIYINGSPVRVEEDSVTIETSSDGVTTVSLTLMPDEIHFERMSYCPWSPNGH